MSILPVNAYVVQCDSCRVYYHPRADEEGYWPMFHDFAFKVTAIETTQQDGWVHTAIDAEAGLDYCKACALAFVLPRIEGVTNASHD